MAAAEPAARVFRFGPFEVDTVNRQLLKKGVSIRLPGQPFDVLALLLEHPGQLVTHRELRDRLWPTGTIVEFDHSIHAAVTRLREALGEDAEHPRFIATVPRHGYRFIAPVSTASARGLGNSTGLLEKSQRVQATRGSDEPSLEPVTERGALSPSTHTRSTRQASHPDVAARGAVEGDGIDSALRTPTIRPAGRSARRVTLALIASFVAAIGYLGVDRYFHSKRVAVVSIPEESIAVLPFVDISEKKEQEYFSDGLAEELLDLLAKTPGLHVIARTSSFSFKGKSDDIPTIARKLHVANILEGSVRKSGDRLRVTTQLIRASNGEELWSETYDRELKDVFAVQDEIAAAVVGQLKLKLAPVLQSAAHRTSNIEAYNEYLLGQQFFNRTNLDGYKRAIDAYRRAMALDPAYVAPYEGLAAAEYFVADETADAAGYQRALAAAVKAVELGPDDPNAYAARGFIRHRISWDWSGAQADYEKAIALDPGDARFQQRYGTLLATLGRLPEALAAAKKAIELDPLKTGPWQNLAEYLLFTRDFAAAREANRRALEISPESTFALNDLGTLQLLEGNVHDALATFQRNGFEVWRLYGIAMAEHTLKDPKASQQALDELIAKHAVEAAYQVAQVYAWRGEKNKAFEWLERADVQRDAGLIGITYDPRVDSLRGDPRYKAFLRKMKLPE